MGSSSSEVATPWQVIASQAPFASEDDEYWYSKVAPLAGRLMEWASYPPSEQLRVLAFIRDYLLASLGPRPSPSGEFHWKTLLHYDSTPVQLSLNFHKSKKTIRTANVPISALSGTPEDPANQQASIDALRRQQDALPTQDLTWFDQCVERFFVPPPVAGAIQASVPPAIFQQAVQCMISHDFPANGSQIQCKVEFCPALKTMTNGRTLKEEVWDGIAALEGDMQPYARSLAVLEDFTVSDGAAQRQVLPIFFAFDTVLTPAYPTSRLKIYYATKSTSLNDMVYVYTLGGRLHGPDVEQGVAALRRLWALVVDVPAGLGDDESLPPNEHPCAAVIFNYEVWPGAEQPTPKIYVPAHHYGKSEMEIAEGMDRFWKSEGLDERYKEQFTKCFVNEEGEFTAVHHDISLSYRGGSPYVTSYFKPELQTNIK